jgi:ceramide glucosyltransferase
VPALASIAALAGGLLLAAASVYALLALVAGVIWRLRRPPRVQPALRPPVTVLKPLCGAEPELYANLRSFCVQDYPNYQLVFGARDARDPAIALVQRLRCEFPWLDIDLVIDEAQHGANRKVSNLANMLPSARHDLLVIADSDARVAADYLHAVTRPLLDPSVGLVTCIYRSVPAGGVWARLGSMYVNDWYMPSVLLAWLFGHRGYASGQTMVLRRATLAAVGGLGAVANHLADDYQIGERVRALGLRIVLSRYLPETVQSEPSADDLLNHELRWMRTIRVLAPGSFRFLFVTFTLPLLALGLTLAAARPAWAVALVPLALAGLCARLGLALLPRVRAGGMPYSDLWLLPLRDSLLCWTWVRALLTSRVRWRGSEFEVDRHGLLHTGCRPLPE